MSWFAVAMLLVTVWALVRAGSLGEQKKESQNYASAGHIAIMGTTGGICS
jgi:hypothetical protein